MQANHKLVTKIKDLVIELPDELVYRLAESISRTAPGDWQRLKDTVPADVTQPAVRKKVERLMELWKQTVPEMPPAAVALALRTAMEVENYRRHDQQLELVWSGPDSSVIPLRRTDQALIQLINEADTSLHIVSFAVYRIGTIAAAIIQAAERGVSICIYLETPDTSGGKIAYDTVNTLGSKVAERASIYVWPLDQRQHTVDGKHGSLHAKIAVADGRLLLISSANLTRYAMKLNMEMGVLVRGGQLPAQVEAHLERLVEEAIFRKV